MTNCHQLVTEWVAYIASIEVRVSLSPDTRFTGIRSPKGQCLLIEVIDLLPADGTKSDVGAISRTCGLPVKRLEYPQ